MGMEDQPWYKKMMERYVIIPNYNNGSEISIENDETRKKLVESSNNYKNNVIDKDQYIKELIDIIRYVDCELSYEINRNLKPEWDDYWDS